MFSVCQTDFHSTSICNPPLVAMPDTKDQSNYVLSDALVIRISIHDCNNQRLEVFRLLGH